MRVVETDPKLDWVEIAYDILRLGPFAASLWLHTDKDVPQPEWDAALARLITFLREQRLSVADLRTLVLSDGGAPNAIQRARVRNEILKGHSSKSSVITMALSNPLRRGLATALQWMNPDTRFFLPRELSQALAHIDLAPWSGALAEHFAELATLVAPNRTYAAASLFFNLERQKPSNQGQSGL